MCVPTKNVLHRAKTNHGSLENSDTFVLKKTPTEAGTKSYIIRTLTKKIQVAKKSFKKLLAVVPATVWKSLFP